MIFEDGRVYGDGVNVAARIRALADPGGICVSDEVQHSIQNQANVVARPLGEHELRNVPRPISLFALTGHALAARGAAATPGRARTLIAPRFAYALAVVGILAVAAWWLARPAVVSGEIRSIAVLPLENLSGDPAQEYFADGMTEALTSNLAKLGALHVISRTSAMRYKGARQPLPEIARELGVDAVIEGSVLRDDDRVRITAQLIHAATDRHLWAESYEREVRNVLALQAEIARAIAAAVALELTPQESTRLRAERPVNPAAYEAYLKGRFHWDKRTGEELRRGVEYFQQAIEADPTFAPAYAGLADSYTILASWWGEPPSQAMPKARAAAERALALDDTLAEAHASLGAVKHWYEWDWAGAEREYRRAMELNPGYATAVFWHSELLSTLGWSEETLAEHQRAHELDPLSSVITTVLGMRYMDGGDYERAIELFRETLEHEPDNMLATMHLGLVYAKRSEFDEALPLLRRGVERWPGDVQAVELLAEGLALAGRRDEALALIDRLETPDGRPIPAFIAKVYATLHEPDLAFEWLERAYVERSRLLVYLNTEHAWGPIRSDPRFADLIRRVGLPQQ